MTLADRAAACVMVTCVAGLSILLTVFPPDAPHFPAWQVIVWVAVHAGLALLLWEILWPRTRP